MTVWKFLFFFFAADVQSQTTNKQSGHFGNKPRKFTKLRINKKKKCWWFKRFKWFSGNQKQNRKYDFSFTDGQFYFLLLLICVEKESFFFFPALVFLCLLPILLSLCGVRAPWTMDVNLPPSLDPASTHHLPARDKVRCFPPIMRAGPGESCCRVSALSPCVSPHTRPLTWLTALLNHESNLNTMTHFLK